MIRMNAEHTVRLINLMEHEKVKPHLDKALSTYPLYTPVKSYDLIPTREELNERILNHYKFYEIGAETIGRFLDELRITMCEIMPYYNELFKTVEIMSDLPNPFDNVDVIETVEETRQTVTKSSGTSQSTESTTGEATDKETTVGESKKENKFSDTPQNNIDDIDDYLTNRTEDNETGESETNRQSESETTQNANAETSAEGETADTFKHVYTKTGNQGVNTYAHDMNEFRTSIIDVVNQIVNDRRIAELFLLIF